MDRCYEDEQLAKRTRAVRIPAWIGKGPIVQPYLPLDTVDDLTLPLAPRYLPDSSVSLRYPLRTGLILSLYQNLSAGGGDIS